MNDGLRWLLVLGCLCIVFLEAPQDLLQVFQDCGGAYPAQSSSATLSASTNLPSSSHRAAAGELEQDSSDPVFFPREANSIGEATFIGDAAFAGDESFAGDPAFAAQPALAGEAASSDVTLTALQIQALSKGTRSPSALLQMNRGANRGSEDDRVEKSREDRTEFRAEFATGR